jgi:hypothetical protein
MKMSLEPSTRSRRRLHIQPARTPAFRMRVTVRRSVKSLGAAGEVRG